MASKRSLSLRRSNSSQKIIRKPGHSPQSKSRSHSHPKSNQLLMRHWNHSLTNSSSSWSGRCRIKEKWRRCWLKGKSQERNTKMMGRRKRNLKKQRRMRKCSLIKVGKSEMIKVIFSLLRTGRLSFWSTKRKIRKAKSNS